MAPEQYSSYVEWSRTIGSLEIKFEIKIGGNEKYERILYKIPAKVATWEIKYPRTVREIDGSRSTEGSQRVSDNSREAEGTNKIINGGLIKKWGIKIKIVIITSTHANN